MTPIKIHNVWCNYYMNGTASVFVEYTNTSTEPQDIILEAAAELDGRTYGESTSYWTIAPNASGPGALLVKEFDVDPFFEEEPTCSASIKRDPNP